MEQIEPIKQIKQYIEFIMLITLLLLCGWATYQRNFTWKDDFTLWSDVAKKSPEKYRTHNNLGFAYSNIKEQYNLALLECHHCNSDSGEKKSWYKSRLCQILEFYDEVISN